MQSFPSSFIARRFRFKEEEFFEIPEAERAVVAEAPHVDFGADAGGAGGSAGGGAPAPPAAPAAPEDGSDAGVAIPPPPPPSTPG